MIIILIILSIKNNNNILLTFFKSNHLFKMKSIKTFRLWILNKMAMHLLDQENKNLIVKIRCKNKYNIYKIYMIKIKSRILWNIS